MEKIEQVLQELRGIDEEMRAIHEELRIIRDVSLMQISATCMSIDIQRSGEWRWKSQRSEMIAGLMELQKRAAKLDESG